MDRYSRLREFSRKQFALDVRSLACFRVGLGLLILIDCVLRLADLTAFYSDRGIVPRSLFSIGIAYPSQWSFHLMNGSATFQFLLFVVTGSAAGMLACGYRTRTATVVCWLMLVSLHTRNPLVLNAGDKYLELLCFWAIFLPIGERWSLDSRRLQNLASWRVTSLGTFALHVQVLLVYLCTGLLKYQVDAWQSGDAIRLALSKDYLVTGIGQRLLDYAPEVTWMTHATLWWELVGPVALLLSRGWLRLIVIGIFMAFHLGLALCFTIGLFPYVCIVAFLAFLPSEFWRWLLRDFQPPENEGLVARPSWSMGVPQKAIVSFVLLAVVWSNLESLGWIWPMPDTMRSAAIAFRWPQSWRLFVNLNENEIDDGWFVFHGQFADGTSEDLVTGASPVSYEKPPLVSATFPNFRWRKLCTNIRQAKYKPVATYLGEYLLLERDRMYHDVHNLLGLQIIYVQPSADADRDSKQLLVFGQPFATSMPLTHEVLFEWRNEARKYHDAFIRE